MRIPRPTAVLKWMGLSVCILLFAAWFWSRWKYARADHAQGARHQWAVLSDGRLWLGWNSHNANPVAWSWSAHTGPNMPEYETWNWVVESYVSWGVWEIKIPLYIPFLLLAAPTAWLFYRDRRRTRWAREGRCAGCGYDTAGLAAGSPCPECGKGGSA